MPTVPLYNQGATEEAGLTRAKRRVIKAMKSGVAKLTERPDTDPTGGSADELAKLLITQFEDLTALSRQIVVFLGDGEKYTTINSPETAVKALKLLILATKVVARILRLSKGLVPNMRFLDLGIMSDLKAVQDESSQEFLSALRALNSLDLSKFSDEEMSAMGNEPDEELGTVLSEWDDEDDDLSTVGSISLGSKRSSGSTSSKSGQSGSTQSKRSFASAPMRGVRAKPKGRLGTMFQYMFGAAEELARPMGSSLDRPPGKGKGKPRPRPFRRPIQEFEDEDMTQAVQRGQRIAEMEEEEFQALARDGTLPGLEPAETDEQKDTDSEILARLHQLNEARLERIPFTRFTVGAYEDVIGLLRRRYLEAVNLLNTGYNNFNAYRQQRVLPARAADADVANAVKTGSGMYGDGFYNVQGTASRFYGVTPQIQRTYSVGGSSDILYRREGLPRFL